MFRIIHLLVLRIRSKWKWRHYWEGLKVFWLKTPNETVVSRRMNVPDLEICTWVFWWKYMYRRLLPQLSLGDCKRINCNPHQVLGLSLVPSTCGVLMCEEKWKDHVWRTHSCWTATCSCNWVPQEHCLKRLLFTLKSKNCTCVCPFTFDFHAQKDQFLLTLFLRFLFMIVVRIWWYNKPISLGCLLSLFPSVCLLDNAFWVDLISFLFYFFSQKGSVL